MKKTLLLILAMCFAFAMPAQATEGYEGFAPLDYSAVSDQWPDGSGKVTDNKVTTCRCMQSRLEAADLYLSKVTSAAKITDELMPSKPTWRGAMHEVGWRVSATAT